MMEQANQNKEFIIRYYNAISGVIKTKALLDKFIIDEHLLNHIAFFDSVFPKYEMFADELTAEDTKVVVRARFRGVHKSEFMGIAATNKQVEFPFVISYEIANGKIVQHWLFADNAAIMEQLGVVTDAA